MKKTRFFLMALLLMTVLVFASCGNKDKNNDGVPDDQQNSMTQDLKNGAEDLKNGAEDLGNDIENGVDRAANDVRDAVDGNNANDVTGNNSGTKSDVSRNTADNGTYSQVQ